MKCPVCGHLESKVLDSRPANEGSSIRRRRECLACQKRFTTFETIENLSFMVVKKDKTRESFDRMKVKAGIIRACEKRQVYNRQKLMNGILRACEKTPVSFNEIERIVMEIETTLNNKLDREVSSTEIGELVMQKLKDLDEVAYVRFASVYRQFKDITTFRDELDKLLKK